MIKQLKNVGTAFLTNREVSAQEASYRLLSLPMRSLSRSVVFNTNEEMNRVSVTKSTEQLCQLHDDNQDG